MPGNIETKIFERKNYKIESISHLKSNIKYNTVYRLLQESPSGSFLLAGTHTHIHIQVFFNQNKNETVLLFHSLFFLINNSILKISVSRNQPIYRLL